ncbi:hypothetical protein FHT40_004577 [Mycolicibacterium sp. BK556]|nr:hypothetical protein [Mycolicibacterium sp. BK556]MBB3635089.1 hypothetical protein [Mycolicibacterium sp. BK607]TDO07752.1 hypothetical protein EV580_5318 [Mycobacterium sp. BK086]
MRKRPDRLRIPPPPVPRPKIDLNLPRLAWDLVDQRRSCLGEVDLERVFIQLGVGEYAWVIRAVLEASKSSREPLPRRLFDDVLKWVDGYAAHDDYPRLRQLVTGALLQPTM